MELEEIIKSIHIKEKRECNYDFDYHIAHKKRNNPFRE